MSFACLEKLTALLGAEHACACGRRHAVPTRHVVYAEDAAEELARLMREVSGGAAVTVIADARTWEVAGRELARACRVAGWLVKEHIVPDGARGTPVCDDETFREMQVGVPATDVYLAAGSGVINDVTKWLAHARGAPYGVMATAASMNGYAAANVAPRVRGGESAGTGAGAADRGGAAEYAGQRAVAADSSRAGRRAGQAAECSGLAAES